jgi:hypothetical protein
VWLDEVREDRGNCVPRTLSLPRLEEIDRYFYRLANFQAEQFEDNW